MADPRKPRVLLVDDEMHLRMLMKTVITSMNCDIVGEAKNGAEAVERYKQTKPDLTLLDINMPVKNGEEALREIIEHDPDAFVIMLTSITDMESVETCLSLGAANYIRKDTPLNEIKKFIRETWALVKKGD